MTYTANTLTLNTNLNVDPYYDDFDEDKNFHRILFRPGFAVQGRELTQMQSILQNQIDRFGEHVFKEGSVVSGLELNFDNKLTFVKIRDRDSSNTIVNVNNFVNLEVTGATSNIKAIVVNSLTGSQAETPNLKTLYVKYIDTGDVSVSGNTFFTLGEVITSNTGAFSANVASSADSVGIASSIGVSAGIVFAKDHFIRVPAQEIVLGRYSTNVSLKIGLNLIETIVTSSDDSTLLDPAEGSYNYAAPGANRLKLTGVLTSFGLSADTGSNFIELFRIENGIFQSKTNKASYSEIKDYIAQRTSDINGSFLVRGLNVRLREHLNQSNNQGVFLAGSGGDSTKLVVDVEPGKAYVEGYDIETIVTKHIPIEKSTTFESLEAVTISSNYGNYVTVKEVAGVWDVNNHGTVTLFDAATRAVSNNTFSTASPAGSSIGTARVRSIEYDTGTAGSFNSTFNLYLYDIQMTANTFSNVKSVFIDNSASSQANGIADIVANTALLNEIDFNKAIFKVPANNIRRLRDTNGNIDTNFEFTKKFDVTIGMDGTFSLATGAVDETLPYSVGALNASQKRDGFYVVLNSNTISSSTVDTGSLTNGANTVTGLTSATSKFNIGDVIAFSGYANSFTVTAVSSTTLTTLQPALAAISSQAITKKFVKGQVIDMAGVGGDGASRIISVASSTSATFDIQESLTATVSAIVITDLNKIDGREIAKAYNSGRLVQVTTNQSNGSVNTVGPWNLGISDIDQITEVRRKTANVLFTTSTEGVDVTTSFILDNGQTDNLYKHGKLKLKSTPFFTPAAGDVYLVKLNFFSHDTSQGVGYFSVDSYPIDDNNVANTTAITTQQIPLYTSITDGTVFPLRDSIDIRPRITDTATNTTVVGSATVNPAEGSTIQSPAGGLRFMGPNKNLSADLDFYLARKDVVSLSPTGEFRVTSGRPSLNPLYPEEPSGHLPIAKVNIPPFPSLSQEVGRQFSRPDLAATIQPVRTERYTMKDIGSLRDRVDRIEYYTRLSLLEQSAKNLNFADVNGVDRFKNGIIVDTFTGHNIGNVYSPDYKAAIDRFNGQLRPQFRLNNVDLNFQSSNSANIIIRPRDAIVTVGGSAIYTVGETVSAGAASGKLVYQVGRKLYLENVSGSFAVSSSAVGGTSSSTGVISAVSIPANGKYATLPYQHNKVIDQPFATTTRNAAGLFWNFLGNVALAPDQDFWVDTTTAADVQINFESNFDNWPGTTNAWETEWNNWENLWTGVNVLNTEEARVGTTFNQFGQQFGLFQNENILEITERQTRTGIRSGIFPETRSERTGPRVIDTNIIPFMRSRIVQVTGRGFKPNTRLHAFFDDTPVNSFITPTNSSFVNTSNEGSNLASDSDGDVYCTFRVPADQSLRFRVGDRKFRLTDNPTNATGVGLVTTSGEAIYSARGLSQTVQDTIVSTRVPVLRQEAVTEDRTLTSTRREREGAISEVFEGGGFGGIDPIAQTFRVSDYTSSTSVAGVFLTKIDLYFASKDATRPVFVEIREVDPSTSYVTSKVVPFSIVTLEAADINTSEDGSAPTPVFFSTPIHLLDGKDYAIAIKPAASNPNVSLFVARIGEEDLITGQRVSEQPAVGVLFASANDRTWTAVQEEDLKFDLYIANFDTTLTGSVVFKNEDREFLKITGSNTFNVIGESVVGQTTIVGTNILTTSTVDTIAIAVAGTGYSNGDIITVTGGTGVLATANVTTGASDTIPATLTLISGGSYTTLPTLSGAATTNDGSGDNTLTVNLTTVNLVNGLNNILSVNPNLIMVGNTSSANGILVSQSSNTVIVKTVSLADKFTVGERVNVFISGVKQEPHITILSASTPTGKVAYFDNVNYGTGNTALHLDNLSGSFTVGEQLRGQLSGRTTTIDSIDKLEIDTLHLNAGYLSFEGTQVSTSARLNTTATVRDTAFRLIEDNENTSFSTPKFILSKTLETNNISGQKSGEFKFDITASDSRLSPVIDVERVNAIIVENKINSDISDETNPTGGNAEAKYLTRTLALADGQDAEDIVVRLTAYKPAITNIDVFYKILNKDDSDSFVDRNWVLMEQKTPAFVTSDSEDVTDFKTYDYGIFAADRSGASGEVQYTNSQGVTFTGFKYFAIKIVLRSSSSGTVPRVKDFTAISLQI